MEKKVEKLTLKEKVRLCSGASEWTTKSFENAGIPSVRVADGPHGLRKTVGKGDNLGLVGSYPSTCFPAECILACSYDRELAAKMARAIAFEAGTAGVCTFLGPGVNIKRNPLCGRNFEYLSEDPYLAGRMAAAYIKAAEETGIGTSLKHFACNNQEYYRMTSDSRLDERTLREIYLTAFEYAVKNGKPSTVMCAYNLLNGTSCSDNKYLLTDILRDEWGFEGMVVSDWGALNNRTEAFKAGCDLIMPGGSAFGEKQSLKDVKEEKLDISDIDKCANRVSKFVCDKSDMMSEKTFSVDFDEHHDLAREIATKSAVLLKNEDNILPLDNDNLVIIGDMARNFRYQGAGSSKINPTKVDDLLSFFPDAKYAAGCLEDGSTSDELLEEAVILAKNARKVIVVAGLPSVYEAEGLDRRTMAMPDGHLAMINAVTEVNENVIVVLLCGCAVEVPWADKVKGIIWMGLPGQAGPGALADLLLGKVNPCGKLAETWPMSYCDVPSSDYYLKEKHAEYREGIYVGYRYYEKAGIISRFPFGYGLSYTTFEYSNLLADEKHASVTITNTGSVFGGEAVLMFVNNPQNGIHRPLRELKGFEKVYLEPGESKVVEFELDDRSFAVWNKGWKKYAGEYGIQIGTLTKNIMVTGEESIEPENNWYRSLKGEPSREDYLSALGYTPVDIPLRPYTANSTISDVANDSLLIRIIYAIFQKIADKKYGKNSIDYLVMMSAADESPLRVAQMFLGMEFDFANMVAKMGNRRLRKKK